MLGIAVTLPVVRRQIAVGAGGPTTVGTRTAPVNDTLLTESPFDRLLRTT